MGADLEEAQVREWLSPPPPGRRIRTEGRRGRGGGEKNRTHTAIRRGDKRRRREGRCRVPTRWECRGSGGSHDSAAAAAFAFVPPPWRSWHVFFVVFRFFFIRLDTSFLWGFLMLLPSGTRCCGDFFRRGRGRRRRRRRCVGPVVVARVHRRLTRPKGRWTRRRDHPQRKRGGRGGDRKMVGEGKRRGGGVCWCRRPHPGGKGGRGKKKRIKKKGM